MVKCVKASGAFEGALYSAAGSLSAATMVSSGKLKNAFVFTGYGDHHAGSNFFGGGCYFNGAAIAIQELEDSLCLKRFAIIDTDAHHGDGTWELFADRPEVLYICFCR
jgi:acetoin utilization deacetylase AcuC-like enzyme